ncbi:hypothetical protein [Psychrobacillus psychrodurans]|uniref:hypothetical protein n=1 Tax=Psychrobacillus psychrodurans TaxID=126157 RepID=UPI0008E7C883|nr:hypothetical protein [Psychrobacillus psychrodurans]MCZ8542337.1 hypothetical protein [Psychrobacillus psychrodurans]SFN24772.1 hypothetical protein SAMN05421832_12612 [Psychrobacillus psychrodurans]
MGLFMIFLGVVLVVISIRFLILVLKKETNKSKISALIYYIAEPFGGSILLYLGILLIIVGIIYF